VGRLTGTLVSVLVGVNNSAPSAVTVGVNVSGVGVEVANRFWVGMGVALINGVGVSTGIGGVAVALNEGRLIFGKPPEQPARRVPNRRVEINFFIMRLLRCSTI